MASSEVEEIIKRVEMLPRDEQLYLIALLNERARASTPAKDASQPLVGEELIALLERINRLPYTPHLDGRTDVSANHDDILYPKHGDIP